MINLINCQRIEITEEINPFIKNEDKNSEEKKVSKIIEKDEESIEDNEKNT